MSVYKRPTSPHFHYDFQWRGHRFYGSTEETDRRAAERFERAEKDRVKAAAASAVPRAEMPFDLAADLYWQEIGQHTSEHDLESKLGRLVEMIGPNTAIGDIDDEMLASLVVRRRCEIRENAKAKPGKQDAAKARPVSAATVNRTTTELLRRVLTFMRKKKRVALPKEPIYGDHILREPKERIRELAFDEEARIEAFEREGYREIRLFAQATGLRRRNCTDMTWSQVDWENGVIRVVQKGEDPHQIPLTPELIDLLWPLYVARHHETAVFTFVAERTRNYEATGKRFEKGKRYPITYEAWGTEHRRLCAAAGVKDFRIHDQRHTAGSRTMRASKNMRAVQKLLGHKDLATTARYAHAMQDDVAEAMSARSADEARRRDAYEARVATAKGDAKSRPNPDQRRSRKAK